MFGKKESSENTYLLKQVNQLRWHVSCKEGLNCDRDFVWLG